MTVLEIGAALGFFMIFFFLLWKEVSFSLSFRQQSEADYKRAAAALPKFNRRAQLEPCSRKRSMKYGY